jgi:proline dehydrogenase
VTYLGENVCAPAGATRATATYLGLLDELGRRGLAATPSLKLSHLGLDLDEGLCVANLTRIVERARGLGVVVWIDMESSRYTDRTLEVYARLRPAHPNLACVVQAYLRRTPGDVERLVSLGATVRLCKGAYHEPPRVAYPDKRDVDASYARLAERLLAPDAQAHGVYPGFATHDERLQRHVLGLATICTRRCAPPGPRYGSWCPSARTGTATSCVAWPNVPPISCSSCATSPIPEPAAHLTGRRGRDYP